MANVFDRLPPREERENIDPQRASEIINEIDSARIKSRENPYDDEQDPRHRDWAAYYNGLWRTKCQDPSSDPRVAESERVTERYEADRRAIVQRGQDLLYRKAAHGFQWRPCPEDVLEGELDALEIEVLEAEGDTQAATEGLKRLLTQFPLAPKGVLEAAQRYYATPADRRATRAEDLREVLGYCENHVRGRKGLRPRGEQ